MAVIKLTFTVSNIADVLAAGYDRIKVYRSTTGLTGAYSEISVAGTRPVLELGKTQYSYTDEAGEDTYWYSNTFFDTSASIPESPRSEPSQGETDPYLSILSVEQLKTSYLFGIDLTDDNGCPFPDELFERYIRSGIAWVSRALDLPIAPVVYTETDAQRLDFYRQDYYKYIRLQVDEYPILSVESIKLVLPTEQEVIDFDPSWWQVQKFSGQIEIIPGRGQLSVITLGQTGAWLPLIYGWTDYIPHVFRVAYTAGFPKGKVPFEIVDLVAKVAALGPLNVAGDLVIGAGIASQQVSIDGIMSRVDSTQSAMYSGYSARIFEYWKEIKETLPMLRQYYKGVPLVVG